MKDIKISLIAIDQEFKQIEGYEDYYISNYGRVLSTKNKTPVILSPTICKNGYLRVNLCLDGSRKAVYVHRLVCSSFVENPDPEKFNMVNHKDQCKYNNHVSNLEWCDSKYNNNYGTRNLKAKETLKKNGRLKKVRCVETGIIYESQKEAGRQTGVHHGSIAHCAKGERPTAGGYHWQYVADGVSA